MPSLLYMPRGIHIEKEGLMFSTGSSMNSAGLLLKATGEYSEWELTMLIRRSGDGIEVWARNPFLKVELDEYYQEIPQAESAGPIWFASQEEADWYWNGCTQVCFQ
jgi:hypothetical protein